MAKIVIAGAQGFIGKATVKAALAEGHSVIALGRRNESETDISNDKTSAGDVVYHTLDLAEPGAADFLTAILDGAEAIIHAAGAMVGDDAAHERDTLIPTQRLLSAILAASARPRLVLVSSFSVYGYAAMPAGTLLSELTPPEPDPQKRDAYTRAKLAQEALALDAARAHDLDLWLIRPGAIYGPGRLDTARLGVALKGRRLSPGGDPTIPAVDVARVAEGLVAAATVPRSAEANVSAPFREPAVVINLTDTELPRQSHWAQATGQEIKAVPRAIAFKTAEALDLVSDLAPRIGRKLPKALLSPQLSARFKDLRYSTQRSEDILGLKPSPKTVERLEQYRSVGT